jgi:hypothetical protein
MLAYHLILAGMCALAPSVGQANNCQSLEDIQATPNTAVSRNVYPVADLLVYCADDLETAAKKGDECAENNIVQRLIGRITRSVSADSWRDEGGIGTIQYYPLGKAVIVNQTQANHEKISALLVSMRKQQVEVAIETRLIAMSPAKAELFLKLADFQEQPNGDAQKAPRAVAFLKDRQVKGWFELFQGDPATNVMQMPKITLIDGQKAEEAVGDEISIPTLATGPSGAVVSGVATEFVGVRGKFLPITSADGQFVRLRLCWEMSNVEKSSQMPVKLQRTARGTTLELPLGWEMSCLENPSDTPVKLQRMACGTTLVLPSGGTAVCYLGDHVTTDYSECGPPVLSKIPYVNRLFTNSGYHKEKHALFLMVTTRIIPSEDDATTTGACNNCELPRIPR